MDSERYTNSTETGIGNTSNNTETEPKKRKRRTKKELGIEKDSENDKQKESRIETASIADDTSAITDEPEPKPKPKRKAKKGETDLNQLKFLLYTLNKGIASLLNFDEWALSEEESELLANSLANFEKEFNLSINSKASASITLIMTSFMLYAPRIKALKNAKATEKQAKQAPASQAQPQANSQQEIINSQFNRRG
ncbi:MAG: hypothetical protein QXI95_02425 [Candidatus Micrarchaeaceae archaeon]